MDKFEIVTPEASCKTVCSGFTLKWPSAFKMDKLVTRGRLSIHLQEAPKLSKEWGEGHNDAFQRRTLYQAD
jgi:hypothetical protein